MADQAEADSLAADPMAKVLESKTAMVDYINEMRCPVHIMTGVTVTHTIAELNENCYFEYDEMLNDGGEVDRYECSSLGCSFYPKYNMKYSSGLDWPINSHEKLVEWLKEQEKTDD